ncbi:MAG: nucleotide exchange factor GrpE [Bacteroidota bacterium]|nr:nucleotide exchange factor GrpE [Bacteroidota bacterium]
MTKKKKILKKDLNQKKIEELKNQVNEGNEKYLRLLAEWENYRKRTLKEKTASVNYGKESIISKILPILDDFERGLKANEKKDTGSGFQLIIQKLFDVLQKEGLIKISVNSGDEFDVNQHEAISQIPIKKPELKGKIVEEIESGYTFNEKIIRFNKVVIGK